MLYNHFQWLTLKGETRFAKCRFPLFSPNPGTLFITLSPKSSRINYGISHNFYHPSVGTQIVTSLGISQLFHSPRFATNRDTFCYAPFVLQRLANPELKKKCCSDIVGYLIGSYYISPNFSSHFTYTDTVRLSLILPYPSPFLLCCNFEDLNKFSDCKMGKIKFEL